MITLAAALAWLEHSLPRLGTERVALVDSAGRVLASDRPALLRTEPRRAAIDGFAVAAAATQGASDYAPLPVAATAIVAGAALPAGADAVLPPHLFDAGCALAPVASCDGLMAPEPLAIDAGPLRPAQLALLARRGETSLDMIRRPAVRLRVAGPKAGPDALTPMLKAMIAAEGGLLGDTSPDLVIHAGRSGPGPDDDGIRAFGTVFAHGIAINPGETAALGTIDGRPALLLPGDPLACATVFVLLAAPALRRLGGRPDPAPITVTLARKITSGLGLLDVVRVSVEHGTATPLAPTLSAGAAADGLVLVPEGSEGYPAGVTVAICKLT